MPAHRKVTDAARKRIHEVARIRAGIPSDKQLASEIGVSVKTVQNVMRDMRRNFKAARNMHELPVSRGTSDESQ